MGEGARLKGLRSGWKDEYRHVYTGLLNVFTKQKCRGSGTAESISNMRERGVGNVRDSETRARGEWDMRANGT